MDVSCSACGALHFKQEKVRDKTTFDDCCRHSRIRLDHDYADFPSLLKQLFLRQEPRWRSFQERIRSLNSSLSFASVNCTRATEYRQQNEAVPYVFRIQGKVFCLFNTAAHPNDALEGYGGRKYGQLYICDSEEAEQHRRQVSANRDMDFGLCSDLDRLMRNVSPHARAYRLLREVEEAERIRMQQLGRGEEAMPNIQLVFNTTGVDLRVYNPPAANEVAAIFVQNPDGLIPPEDLVVTTRGGELRRISSLDRYVDALTYPLFNPTGRPGWTKDMPYTNPLPGDRRRNITRREFLCYALADRENVFNPIQLGGRLTQEYIVVNYARMESDRLLWLSEHQSDIRAAQYSVQNQARQIAEDLNVDYEAVKVLPSSHPGSPRYMQQQYQNAMAIVRQYGRPDIFLSPCDGGHWSPCKKSGACDKNFPKELQEATTFNENAYVKLKRPNNGRFVDFGGGRVADNRFVVPHCPYLLRRYNAHINCEIVAGLKAVKYLYKYIYKGLDRADVEVTGDSLVINEIESHLNARYVSPPEAAMRLLGKPLQGKSHAVLALHVHLPGERAEAVDSDVEDVEDNDDEERDPVALNDEPYATEGPPLRRDVHLQKSMLEAYFKLNRSDVFARDKPYAEIPEHYKWDGSHGKWIRRAPGRRKVIGRLHSASVTKPELVRLRILLLHVTGATSFEDLRRDPFNDSLIHPTFGAACIARGLIVADEEWALCLEEAAAEKMPRQLRRLFVTILVHNHPSNPLDLWEKFQLDLSEDYRRNAADEQLAIHKALRDIVRQMQSLGVNVAAQFPDLSVRAEETPSMPIDVEYVRRLGIAFYQSLTQEQRDAVDVVLWHVKDMFEGVWRGPRCVFISGEGGTGGDWKQVHPILPRAPTSEAIALSVKRSQIWRFFEEKRLTFNMRARHDPQWAQYLLRVGNGVDFAGTEGEIFLPDEIISSGDLVDDVYQDLFGRQMQLDALTEYLAERAIIAPLNQTCDEYNRDIVDRLHGTAVEHISVDEVVADTVQEGEYYSTEFLNTLNPAELPPSRLRLKQGVVCMLLRNLRVEDGLCNGSRLLVTKVGRRFVEVLHTSGTMKGQREFLPRISLISNDGSLPFKFKRLQYPIKVCYAFSVNKAQGQSLRFCGVDLSYECFSHGQLYVALSRVGSSANIKVKLRPEKRTVRNVVEKELLR